MRAGNVMFARSSTRQPTLSRTSSIARKVPSSNVEASTIAAALDRVLAELKASRVRVADRVVRSHAGGRAWASQRAPLSSFGELSGKRVCGYPTVLDSALLESVPIVPVRS